MRHSFTQSNRIRSLLLAAGMIVGGIILGCATDCLGRPLETYIEMPAEVLRNKIRGGLLGQILGNLNGLPHEMKYINEPGNVREYTPSLPEGARTDDDTDLEWVYVVEMQRSNTIMLRPQQLVRLWKQRINKRIWCSNQYARQLMDIGLEPPLTGSIVFNPWADFNISGQFVCETFGLLAPAMPETAAKIGLNYTTVTISDEPAQTTQLFTSMIATAFVSDDIDQVIEAGLAALDPECQIRQIVNDVRRWHREHPDDWRAVRRLIKDKYSLHNGAMRDRNGHELNTASTIAALLYGNGDFTETLRTAFNFGWDADNNAAICLDMAEEIKRDYPAPWTRAIEALANNRKVMQVLFFESPIEAGDRLRQKAISAGLKAPKQRIKIW